MSSRRTIPFLVAIPRLIVLAVLCVFIVASVFVGELAFRADRTVLRYGYVQAALDRWLAPLNEPQNFDEFVDALLRDIRRALDWRVPLTVQTVMQEAAKESFSASWMEGVVKRMHARAYAVMRGQATTIELTIPLGTFLTNVATRAGAELPPDVARGVTRGIGSIPRSIDLWASLDEQTRASAERWIRRIPFISTLLQYALPGLFIALTLVFRRPGSAMITSGAGIALGGGAMLLYIHTGAARTTASIASTVASSLPGRPGWIVNPVEESVASAIGSGEPFAFILIGIGIILAVLGLIVVRRWHDSFRPLMGRAAELLRDR